MKKLPKILRSLLILCIILSLTAVPAFASSFTDAHGNVIELDDTLEAYSSVKLSGADNIARKQETNLGDLWADALRWFATSGKINEYFEEDDVAAGNTSVAVDADHIVALWNGGNLRADIEVGKFGAAELAAVLPYPNKVAIVYMTGAELTEALEAASQGLPYTDVTAAACASFMQVSGLIYTVNAKAAYDAGEAYGNSWYKADSINRVTINSINGQAYDAAATYAVITSNANYNGMDSSYVFAAAKDADTRGTITTAVVRDIVWMYIKDGLGSAIGEQYAAPQGRITVTVPTYAFTDVPGIKWFFDEVTYCVDAGLFEGNGDGTFAPDDTMSSAELITVLYRVAGNDTDNTGDHWYSKQLTWATENGIVTVDNFEADSAITREDFITMFFRTVKLTEKYDTAVTDAMREALKSASDYDELDESNIDAFAWSVAYGLIEGTTDSDLTVNPDAGITRAEFCTMLMRYYEGLNA